MWATESCRVLISFLSRGRKAMKSLLLASVLLFACLAGAAYAQQRVDAGALELDGASIALSSTSFPTALTIEGSAAVSKPTLKVVVIGENLPATLAPQQVVQVTGANVEFTDIREVSSASSISISRVLLGLAIVVTAVFGAHIKSPSSLLAVVLLAAATVLPLALAPAGMSFEATLQVPSGFEFSDLRVNIGAGSVTMSESGSLDVVRFRLDLCLEGGADNTHVNLDGLAIKESAHVCAKASVVLTNIFNEADTVNYEVESKHGDVTVTWARGYAGSVNAQGASVDIAGNCSSSASGIVCGPIGTGGTVKIVAGGNVNIDAGIVCPVSYRDPAASDTFSNRVPTSKLEGGVIADMTDVTKWKVLSTWSSGGTARWMDNGAIAMNLSAYFTSKWFFVGMNSIPLRSGLTYNFQLDWEGLGTHSSQNYPPVIASINMLVLENFDTPTYWSVLNDTIVSWYTVSSNAFTMGSANTPKVTFTVPRTVENAKLCLQVAMAKQTGNHPNWRINLKNLRFGTESGTTVTAPTSLITTPSTTHVTIPVMPDGLDANPRDNCPFDQSGLKPWHDPATWGGRVPTGAKPITLPENTKVLVTSCSFGSNVYEKIIVPSTSELIFADAVINLRVKDVFVQGALRIGSPTCRLFSKITITFVGAKSTANTICPTCGTKGLAGATGSVIEIHGKQFHHSWTRLAATIWPGEDRVYLQNKVNWRVGQQFVIVTSIYKDYDDDQNEIKTITGVSGDGKTVQFTPPATYYHYGGAEYQTEAVLLSRNIVLQGDEASTASSFGGHMMIMGQGRFSGTQFRRMGQTNMLARYPIHYHLKGASPGEYVQDCVIWQSFYRCVAIHQTHEVLVTRTAAFDATAHCYYLEEGVEENNTLSFNFVGHVRAIGKVMLGGGQKGEIRVENPDLTLPADDAASGFYITNAYNTFIGNSASGGWAGYSFPNLPTPLRFSRSWNVSPMERPTKVFDGNTMHSGGYHFSGDGGCLYVGGWLAYESATSNILTYDSGRFSRDTKTAQGKAGGFMVFTNTKAWMCQMGISHWGERAEAIRYEVHDVRRSIQLFGQSWLDSALINADSNNIVKGPSVTSGFQFYDTWVQTMLTNITYRNFQPNPAATDPYGDNKCIITMTHSDEFKPQGIAATMDLKFENTPASQRVGHKNQNTGASRYYSIADWDGSLVGKSQPYYLGDASNTSGWWNVDSNCYLVSDWQMWACPKVAGRYIGHLMILSPGLIDSTVFPSKTNEYDIGLMSLHGPGIPAGRTSIITRNRGISGYTGTGWYMWLKDGTPKTFTIGTWVVPMGSYIMFAAPYPAGASITVTAKAWSANIAMAQVNTFNELRDGDGKKWFFDTAQNMLYIKVMNVRPSNADAFTRKDVSIYSISSEFVYTIVATCTGTSTRCTPASSSLHPNLFTSFPS